MEHGIISSVKYTDGVVYCDVQPFREEDVYRNIPVLKVHSGFICMPKQGMKAAMDKLEDGTRFIQQVISREPENPDSMREGEITLQLDENTYISYKKKNNGDFDLNLKASGDVNIESSNDININAPNGTVDITDSS